MASVHFLSIPGVYQDRHWIDTNRSLGRVLDRAEDYLYAARDLAVSILQSLKNLEPVMEVLCRNSCPWCPNPCCIVNCTWYDFQDLLFLHLSGQHLPPAQVKTGNGEACRYLGPKGCRIHRTSRPWACIVYLCGVQQRCLNKVDSAKAGPFSRSLESVRTTRHDLEAAVTKALKSCRLHRSDQAKVPIY